MKKIELDNRIVAIVHKRNEWKKGLDFLTPDSGFIQAGTWWYNKGKALKAHRHIENIREVTLTQESIVIMEGCISLILFDKNNEEFYRESLEKGDIAVILNVGHGYEIIKDDTKVIEIKNGPFISVEKDKELI